MLKHSAQCGTALRFVEYINWMPWCIKAGVPFRCPNPARQRTHRCERHWQPANVASYPGPHQWSRKYGAGQGPMVQEHANFAILSEGPIAVPFRAIAKFVRSSQNRFHL